MCGRFVGYRSKEELLDLFSIDSCETEVVANYNIAPTQEILAIVRRDNKNYLEKLHWGLVPFWAKDISIGARMINARAETVHSKPSFRNAFKQRRCLILSDGFYEWAGDEGHKQPYFLTLAEERPFAFAGIWEIWDDQKKLSSGYRSCAIITTAASDTMRPIHHRMPAILKPGVYQEWLDPKFQDTEGLQEILNHMTITELVSRQVSRQVNAVRNNNSSNIKPMKQVELKL
jgi:putative SOS response-associated peptidase YedK